MKIVIATRLHLGRSSSPPSEEKTRIVVSNLKRVVEESNRLEGLNAIGTIAVDGTPRLEGFDYVEAVRHAVRCCQSVTEATSTSRLNVLPVTPWGKFIPALNSLVSYAKSDLEAELILFMSAEVNVAPRTVEILCKHITENKNVIVAGAAMNGHQYFGDSPLSRSEKEQTVPLTGRTTPWNTLCVWNLNKLCLTGFPMVSDIGKSAGVEECATIALLQKLMPDAEARLVKVDGIDWEQSFEDEDRRKWHEEKMKSKIARPKHQLEQLGLSGTVVHC